MIDWLKRDPRELPMVPVGERQLPLVIRRLHNARRMTLRLAPDGSEVRISIPRWGRTAEALAFARSRADWLAEQLSALPVREPLRPGARIPYRGDCLVIEHDPDAPRRPRMHDQTIRIGGAAESLEPRLRRWLENEARELLTDDLTDYCARAERPVPRLSLSNAGRRWGSCSAKGWIRINWRLVMAPDLVRRSVVAHEVAHLAHMDHSPRFHYFLAQLFEGDIAEANAWLKREGRNLFAPFG
ncbi:MAG: SprT family zinc-dependent metalloprotease [Novosphingobium sp.]